MRVFRSSLSIRTFLGRSSVDIQAIELIKQSCLQSTMEEIPIDLIRLDSASEGTSGRETLNRTQYFPVGSFQHC